MSALEAFLDELRAEFPRLRIVEKRGDRLSQAIDRALRIITLGGQRRYLTHFYTVIGDTIYVPDGWDATPEISRIITLRHERVHLRQRRRYTLPGMAFVYLMVPLPLGLAYGRARIEWEAYTETLRATYEMRGRAALLDNALREHVLGQFTGPAYGWMWPFRRSLDRWYDEAIEKILAEASSSPDDSRSSGA